MGEVNYLVDNFKVENIIINAGNTNYLEKGLIKRKKDIIKVDADIEIDFDVIGYVDPGITINIIRNCERVEKLSVELPEKLTNVIKCKNPRCITTTEQEINHIFKLTDRENGVYRCLYCETKAN